MSRPMVIEDLIVFQMVQSVIFVILKDKGLSDEQIGLLLQDNPTELTLKLIEDIREKLDALVDTIPTELEPIDEEWIVDIANCAVEANLNSDGSNKHKSAQGYACALKALKIAIARRGDAFRPNENSPIVVEEETLEDRQAVISKRASDLFRATNAKYGPQTAAKATFEYVAEQNGLATLDALGLSDEDLHKIQLAIISKMINLDS